MKDRTYNRIEKAFRDDAMNYGNTTLEQACTVIAALTRDRGLVIKVQGGGQHRMLKKNDRIAFVQYAGIDIKDGGKTFWVMNDEDLLAILE